MPNDPYFDICGNGEPLILIPGFASGTWSWFRQKDELAKNFRLITFDPRGIAKSRFPDDATPLTMTTFVDDVANILNRLGIVKVNMLGASFGGFVAQVFALRYPERLGKLVLCCTTSGGAGHVSPDPEILRAFTPDPTLTFGESIRKFIRPAFSDEFCDKHADEVENVCLMREANEVSESLYMAQLVTAFSFNTSEQIGSVEADTMVLTGAADRIVPMQNSANLAERMPNAELEIIPGGSHLLFIENATEFNRAVTEFIG